MHCCLPQFTMKLYARTHTKSTMFGIIRIEISFLFRRNANWPKLRFFFFLRGVPFLSIRTFQKPKEEKNRSKLNDKSIAKIFFRFCLSRLDVGLFFALIYPIALHTTLCARMRARERKQQKANDDGALLLALLIRFVQNVYGPFIKPSSCYWHTYYRYLYICLRRETDFRIYIEIT